MRGGKMSFWTVLGVVMLALVCRKLYKIELEFKELNSNFRMMEMNWLKELIRRPIVETPSEKPKRKYKKKKK
jgi:hypothetical protein